MSNKKRQKKLADELRELTDSYQQRAMDRAREEADIHVSSMVKRCREAATAAAVNHGYRSTPVWLDIPITTGDMIGRDQMLDEVMNILKADDGFQVSYKIDPEYRSNIKKVVFILKWCP